MRRSNSNHHPFRKEGRAVPPRPSNTYFVSGVRGHLWFQFSDWGNAVCRSLCPSLCPGLGVPWWQLRACCQTAKGLMDGQRCPNDLFVAPSLAVWIKQDLKSVLTNKSCIYPKYYAWIKEHQSPARLAAICFASHVPLLFEKGLGGLCELSPPLLKPAQRLRRADESTLFSARCNAAERGCLEDFEACIACVRSDRPRNHSRERQRGTACKSRAARCSVFIFKKNRAVCFPKRCSLVVLFRYLGLNRVLFCLFLFFFFL